MPTVCFAANTIDYPQGGGHFWAYLNWALGFLANDMSLYWLESVKASESPDQIHQRVEQLKKRLAPYGLADRLAIYELNNQPLSAEATFGTVPLEQALNADMLFSMAYHLPQRIVGRFAHPVMLDIDPGLLQLWIDDHQVCPANYRHWFTIGESVTRKNPLIPDVARYWHYTPPSVSLEHWPVAPLGDPLNDPFTTVTHWHADEWINYQGQIYSNSKKTAFEPYLDLPRLTRCRMGLALCLGGDLVERQDLEHRGWNIVESHEVAGTPDAYQRYIQRSAGEFSCAKPAYTRLQSVWVSDRTLCFLASGKPVVVQHTGPSRFLPEAQGMFRFHTIEQAADHLQAISENYPAQCRAARQLAEELFSAQRNAQRVLGITLG